MKSNKLVLAVAVVLAVGPVRADVFHMSGGQNSLEFVTVGDPGNATDPSTGYGSVGSVYQMGKYDVTVGQYCQFLNAVATTDTYGLYTPDMATDYTHVPVARSGTPGSYSYAVGGELQAAAANCPMFDVSWGDAARFCNWLQNGQPVGPQGTGPRRQGRTR